VHLVAMAVTLGSVLVAQGPVRRRLLVHATFVVRRRGMPHRVEPAPTVGPCLP
jgi:hypothetical protein